MKTGTGLICSRCNSEILEEERFILRSGIYTHTNCKAQTHFHVASWLTGYGPDGTDGFATYDTLAEALEGAREELKAFSAMAYETAQSFAESEDYKTAWYELKRSEALEMLRANLSADRKRAPLYSTFGAFAALQESQLAEFPHEVSPNTSLYLWECTEEDCEHAEKL